MDRAKARHDSLAPMAAMWNEVLDLAARLRAEREPFVLATVVARDRPQSVLLGARALVRSDGSVTGWVGGGCVRPTVVDEALKALRDGQARLVRIGVPDEPAAPPGVRTYPMTCHGGGRVEVYVEPVLPMSKLILFGVTPVARALAGLAPAVGFEVVAVDPRADAATFPKARMVAAPDAVETELGSDSFVVVATQGEGDGEALLAAVARPSSYVGFVASRKKGRTVLGLLESQGLEPERAATVRYPAGIDLGGMTPGEIALSVLAEMVAVRAGKADVAVGVDVSGGPAPSAAAGLPIHPGSSDPTALHSGGGAEAPSQGFATDPVCGMSVEIASARYLSRHGGEAVYFCCPMCQAAYDKDPAAYAGAASD